MFPTHNSTQTPHRRVRALWAEFETWAEGQRKVMDRRREEISKSHDAKWKTVATKTRAKQDEHDAQRNKLLADILTNHCSNACQEWQNWLVKTGLCDGDWGMMAPEETQRIEKVLSGENIDVNPFGSFTNNVAPQPQYHTDLFANSAPPLTTTARTSNLSASTSSSYTLVNPSEFSTDDELYEATSGYMAAVEDSWDDVATHNNGWGVVTRPGAHAHSSSGHSPQTSSPEHLSSSSSSSTHDLFSHPPTSSRPEMNAAPPKRPPDIDRKGKARVHGPSYVGPHLSSPEESSEEEDFERFKMDIRIKKIYEFHHAAAQADVELALAIQNDRMSKKPSVKGDDVTKITEHEKRILKLQAEKEEERKVIVATERKKRREEIRKRSVLGEPARGANTVSSGVGQDWESLFRKNQPVRLDPDRKAFVVGGEAFEADENQGFDTAFDPRVQGLPGPLDTLRARKQSLGSTSRVTPSGWKAKHAATLSTTALSQSTVPPLSPDPSVPPAWMTQTFYGTSLDPSSSFDSDELHFPGDFSATSTSPSMLPIPSGWGTKNTPPSSAASLLKKVLADPKPSVHSTPANKRGSPSPPFEILSTPEQFSERQHPAPVPVSTFGSKKQVKKGRQAIIKKGGAATKVEEDAEESPTTPTIISKQPSAFMQPRDILQQRLVPADDEISSTPRPYTTMKRVGGAAAPDYSTDFASTPRAGMKYVGVGSSVPGASAWSQANHEQGQQRPRDTAKKTVPALPVGNGWGAMMDEEVEEEESPWQQMQRKQAEAQMFSSQAEQTARDRIQWGRSSQLTQMSESRSSISKPSPSHREESLWEQHHATRVPSTLSQQVSNSSAWSKNAPEQEEETPWNRVMRAKAEQQASTMIGTTISQHSQRLSEPEESPWERVNRLKAQGVLPAKASSTTKPTFDQGSVPHSVHSAWGTSMDQEPPAPKFIQQPASSSSQSSNPYWTPNGSGSQQQMWNPNGQQSTRQSNMPGSYNDRGYETQSNFGYMSQPETTFANGMNGAKGKKLGAKMVTMEEVPDEDGPSGRKRPDQRLPSNSRILLDIVEPKPSVPSTMFSNIFEFGEGEGDEEEEGYQTGLSSMVPTPSTAPTSPPNEIPSLDADWFLAAAEEMKNGNLDSLLESGGSFAAQTKTSPQIVPSWPADPSPKQKAAGSQVVDSAKLHSALESVEAPAAVAPPKVAPAPPAPAPKPEPAAKPNNQIQKGKGKGKGKGRK